MEVWKPARLKTAKIHWNEHTPAKSFWSIHLLFQALFGFKSMPQCATQCMANSYFNRLSQSGSTEQSLLFAEVKKKLLKKKSYHCGCLRLDNWHGRTSCRSAPEQTDMLYRSPGNSPSLLLEPGIYEDKPKGRSSHPYVTCWCQELPFSSSTSTM